MYKIEAFLRPSALEDIQQALGVLGIAGMSVTEVRGFGRQRGHREVYRGAEYRIDFVPKIKVEVVVTESIRDQVINAIVDAAKSGKVGDGKVFATLIQEAVRIRTGETGESAL
ncbi:MAG TPA: P-II family nitrogen regulator [Candidatus Handelsmanbacteria bacterium]|nr:P-II family nitrogen regulator [Candidatus Handelsmanbacteria bacterium]